MNDTPIDALLIGDNPGDALLLQEMLRGSELVLFHVVCADRLSQGLELLETEQVDVVLLDLSLPDSRGMDSVDRVRRHAPAIPTIVMTGLDDDALAMQAV